MEQIFFPLICIIVFAFVILITPKYISHAKRRCLVGKDMNKCEKIEVPEAGGIVVYLAFSELVVVVSVAASGAERPL